MSVFNWKKYDIHEEIAVLHEELRTIQEVKDFVNTKMWIKIHDMMLSKIKLYSKPIKNKYWLQSQRK